MADDSRAKTLSFPDRVVTGRLLGHGRAHYQWRRDQDLSYFVQIQTERGSRTFWGKDLDRAVSLSRTRPQIGDLVGIRRTPQEGRRARWEVESPQFFAERARQARLVRDAHTDTQAAVRAHPELRSTFISLRAAEKVAAQRITDPRDRARFVELVREAMATSIARGQPLPELGFKDPPSRATPRSVDPLAREPEEPTR